MKVLWLASWYPNPHQPVNGDFIQRHAAAVATYADITVVHMLQLGADKPIAAQQTLTTTHGFPEYCIAFPFQPIGLPLLDKIRYNSAYIKHYKAFLTQYIKEQGKPDLVHVHVPMKAGLLAIWLQKKWGIPYLVSEQASYYEADAPDSFYTRSRFFKKNTAKVFQQANAITNVSATIGATIAKLFQVQVKTIHNLVDTTLFYPVKKNTEQSDTFVWVHVSAMGEQKNFTGILTAFAQVKKNGYKDWQLHLVGPYQLAHQALISELALEAQVQLVGEVPHPSVAFALRKAHGFVLFSNHENFPCVVPEALCTGLPVVSSAAGGVAEAIHTNNGIIVPKRDTNALAAAITQVMTQKRQYDGEKIAANAQQKYAATQIGEQFYTLYQQVLEAKK